MTEHDSRPAATTTPGSGAHDRVVVRNALITGGNGAIGRAVAAAFLAEDDRHVTLGVRHHRDAADALADAFPDRCRVVPLDVTRTEDWERACRELEEDGRPVDILVNNAGFHRDNLLANMPEEDWRAVLSANLDAVFHGCRNVVRGMMGRRFGRIINVASLSALLAPAGQTNYAAAKAAVLAFSQSLAKEVARAGITVNCVCPGFIDTEALSDLDPERRRALLREIPMRRLGTPAEVASVVRFLASAEAGYVTGSIVKIDGGIF